MLSKHLQLMLAQMPEGIFKVDDLSPTKVYRPHWVVSQLVEAGKLFQKVEWENNDQSQINIRTDFRTISYYSRQPFKK